MADAVIEIQALLKDDISAQIAVMRANIQAEMAQTNDALDKSKSAFSSLGAAQEETDKRLAEHAQQEALRQREAQIRNQIDMEKFEAGSAKSLDARYNAKRKELNLEEQLEIASSERTGISVAEINRQFNEKKMALDQEENAAKMKQFEDQASFCLSSLDKITAGNKSMAEAHKIIAIAEAEINTAKAVTAAMATPIEIPFIIAEGAMQIAKIESQKFAVGTSYATGGWAEVGEEGPEKMYVPRGSKINRSSSTAPDENSGGHTFHIHAGNDRIVETLRAELRKGGAMTRFANELAIAAGVKS